MYFIQIDTTQDITDKHQCSVIICDGCEDTGENDCTGESSTGQGFVDLLKCVLEKI